MSRYPLGQPIRHSTTVRQLNIDGTTSLVNAGALTLTIAKPDGSQQVYSTPTNDGTGLYHQDIPASDLTQTGHYQLVWTATGTGAGVQPSDFDVYDPFEAAVLPLQDAKDMLNIGQATTTYDAELQSWIATIETSLEGLTGGPLINRTITAERCVLTDAYTVLQVRQRPLVSVTSIVSVASGQALDISAGLDLDPNAGTIRRKLGYPFYGPYFTWLPAMAVTYVAGWGTAVPAAFNSFGRIVIRHLWDTQRGASAAPMLGGGETTMVPGFAFAIPNRAVELLNGTLNGMPLRQEAYV